MVFARFHAQNLVAAQRDRRFTAPIPRDVVGDLVAEAAQKLAEQAVQLEAEAAAVVGDDFFKDIAELQRDRLTRQNIEIFVRHGLQMGILQRGKRFIVGARDFAHADARKIRADLFDRQHSFPPKG